MSILGDNIGFGETLELELKEFTLKKDPVMYFSEDEIEKMVSTGIVDQDKFNIMISDNISHFFKYYIPKYLSVFGNSKLDSATLYMGVNDFGEITGVPFFGEITTDYLKSFVDSIRYFISLTGKDDLEGVDELISNIKFEVVKLNKKMEYLDDSVEKIIQDFKDKKKKYEKDYKENLAERVKWAQKMEYYITRIQDYANIPHYRKEVSTYIIENNMDNDSEISKLVDLLHSDKFIPIGDGNEIRIRKDNKYDIVFWITQYKDYMIAKLKENKPIRLQYANFSQNIYSNQLSLLSNLRYKMIENNHDIEYYLIKIYFPTKFTKKIYFRNNEFDIWNTRIRAIVNSAPGCI